MSGKIVKSVGRVFHILELFDRERRPLSAIEIARQLDYPHTSTLAILKSMQALDYLTHDRETWTFFPSPSLNQVVEWVVSTVHNETIILDVMNDLHESIDETINLSRQTGDFVKIIYGLESTKLLGIRVQQGVFMSLTASHTGMVILATYPDEQVERIIKDLQKRKYPEARSITVEQALAEVRKIRKDQFSAGYDTYIKGIGVVCFPLCSNTGARPFVVHVAGPTDRIRENEKKIIQSAKKSINKHKARLAYPV